MSDSAHQPLICDGTCRCCGGPSDFIYVTDEARLSACLFCGLEQLESGHCDEPQDLDVPQSVAQAIVDWYLYKWRVK